MKQIADDDELRRLNRAGKGLIYNDYSGSGSWGFQYNVLHAAAYRHIVKADTKYTKIFFTNVSEARTWLLVHRGPEGTNWKRCGTCHAKEENIPYR